MRNILACALLAVPCIAATSSLAIAQAPLTEAEIAALAQNPAVNAAIAACSGDRRRLCGGVMPGGGRIVRCLAANAESLSPQCRSAMLEARDTVYAARGGPPPCPQNSSRGVPIAQAPRIAADT